MKIKDIIKDHIDFTGNQIPSNPDNNQYNFTPSGLKKGENNSSSNKSLHKSIEALP